jgi:hypothetical protein
VKQPVSRETGTRKLVTDVARAVAGMVFRQTCARCGAMKRGLYWDGIERAHFCPWCIR